MQCNYEEAFDLLKRIKTLEDFIGQNYKRDINNLGARIELLKKSERAETMPYMCPVCGGSGNKKKEIAHNFFQITLCNPCQGKGIIWG